MNETTVPIYKLLSVTLWALTAGFLLAGWAVYFLNLADLGVMLLTMACPTALGAGVATARTWATCVMRTVRSQGSVPGLSRDLHAIDD